MLCQSFHCGYTHGTVPKKYRLLFVPGFANDLAEQQKVLIGRGVIQVLSVDHKKASHGVCLMKILFVSDKSVNYSQENLEKIFKTAVLPSLSNIEEIAIVTASEPELFAIRWARKLRIPYLGFLYNIHAALDYADHVILIGENCEDVLPEIEKRGKTYLRCFMSEGLSSFEGLHLAKA